MGPVLLREAWAADPPPLNGEMKDFVLVKPPKPAPSFGFTDLGGRELSLTGFKGKLAVVNLWATWCVPCIKEMPSLMRLHARMQEKGLAVLAISQDRGGAKVVEPFLARQNLKALPVFLDPKGDVLKALGVRGLPTTIVIDSQGRELGRMEGDANWDGPEALALFNHFLKEAGGGETNGVVKTGG